MPAKVTTAGNSQPTGGWLAIPTASAKNISLDKKPFNSGTPAMAAEATMASRPV